MFDASVLVRLTEFVKRMPIGLWVHNSEDKRLGQWNLKNMIGDLCPFSHGILYL